MPGRGSGAAPPRPLHSSEAAWIASPAWALVHALGTLVGPGEELPGPALTAGSPARPTTTARFWRELAVDVGPGRAPPGERRGPFKFRRPAEDMLEALLFRPTMNMSGIEAGYVRGPPARRSCPSSARANVDIRLVRGDLDADRVPPSATT